MASDFTVRWSDFSGGDYGTLDPGYAAKDQFSGLNVVRYNSGLLGPRPGLKALTIDWGVAAGTHPVLGPLGFDVKDDQLLITLGDTTYRVPVTAPVADPFDPYPAPVSEFVRFAQGDRNLYGLIDGDLYKHNETTGVVTKITLPGGIKLKALTRWGYYLVAVQADLPYRLWHSTVTIAGPQFDTWGANNYLDVGSNLGIECLKPLYNQLYAGKADGWWSVSGILGELAAVRLRVIGNGPTDERRTTVTTDNRVVYWGNDSVPVWFNGEKVYLDDDYEMSGFTTAFAADTVVATPTGKRVLMIGEQTGQSGPTIRSGMLLWNSGRWTKHRFDIPISAVAGNDVRNATGLPDGVVFMCQRPVTVGNPVSVVTFEPDLNRPGHADDTWATAVDQGSTQLVEGKVDLPAHWENNNRFMRVSRVRVQFRKWPSGVAGTKNRLVCQVVPLGIEGGGTVDTPLQLWEESSDRSQVGGTDWSHTFSIPEMPLGRGFQVRFPSMRGVALREVVAMVEVRTEQ